MIKLNGEENEKNLAVPWEKIVCWVCEEIWSDWKNLIKYDGVIVIWWFCSISLKIKDEEVNVKELVLIEFVACWNPWE